MPLDATRVADIVRAQFPDLASKSVTYLGEGYDSWAFDVNAAWVFRFPKRADVEQQLLVEMSVLPALARLSPIPIPAFRFHGQPSNEFPRHFGGYAKLPGVPAIMLDRATVRSRDLAPMLGRFLSWLHGYPTRDAERLGVNVAAVESIIEEVRTEALDDFELVGTVATRAPLERWHAYLKAGPEPASRTSSAAVLLHNDFSAEHVLCDPERQTITGIIDWSDMAVGDPSLDLAGIFHWGGDALIEAVLSYYDRPIDADSLTRARYLAACRGVGDVRFGLDLGRDDYVAAGIRALELSVSAAGTE
jgi:aminoglycoside phosphotransferase (APT) family kinase protein